MNHGAECVKETVLVFKGANSFREVERSCCSG